METVEVYAMYLAYIYYTLYQRNAKPYRMPVDKNIHTVRCTNISYLQQSFIYLEKVNFVLLHVAHHPAATPSPTRIVVRT